MYTYTKAHGNMRAEGQGHDRIGERIGWREIGMMALIVAALFMSGFGN